MKTAEYGRIVFALSAVLFGIIGLMWHDADTWQALPYAKQPIVADVLALAQIAGGAAILFGRTARWSAIVLGAVYALFTLAYVPPTIAKPAAGFVNLFEFLSLVCGALAAYAAIEPAAARSAALGRAARIGLGICTVSFALAQILYPKITASLVPTWILPNQIFWVWFTTLAFVLAAIAMLINVQAQLATRLMTVMLALFGLLVWVPALITQPQAHGNWSEFALNFLITGAAGLVAELKSS